jgi:hypothetical protein
MPSNSELGFVNDEPPLRSLEFVVSDVKNVLLELDSSKKTKP